MCGCWHFESVRQRTIVVQVNANINIMKMITKNHESLAKPKRTWRSTIHVNCAFVTIVNEWWILAMCAIFFRFAFEDLYLNIRERVQQYEQWRQDSMESDKENSIEMAIQWIDKDFYFDYVHLDLWGHCSMRMVCTSTCCNSTANHSGDGRTFAHLLRCSTTMYLNPILFRYGETHATK